ncbi:MAG: tetratricopeptide repeat protein, partial [Myxococcota bacterium]
AMRADDAEAKEGLQRIECLEGRKRAFVALLEVLDEPTAARAATAPVQAARLPLIASCADAAFVSAELPTPEDEALREPVRAVREELAAVSTLSNFDDIDAALVSLEALSDRATALGFEAVQVEVLDALASTYLAKERLEEAEAAAARAYALAPRASAMERAKNHEIRAQILLRKQEPERALLEARRAMSEVRQTVGDNSVELTAPLLMLAQVEMALGNHDVAAKHVDRARALATVVLGPDHPGVAALDQFELSATMMSGDFEDSVQQARAALVETERVAGAQSLAAASQRSALGTLLLMAGQYRAAEVETLRAVEIAVAIDAGGAQTLTAYGALVAVKLVLGRYHEVLNLADLARTSYKGDRDVMSLSPFLQIDIAVISSLVELGEYERALAQQASLAAEVAEIPFLPPVMKDVVKAGSGFALARLGRSEEALPINELVRDQMGVMFGPDNQMSKALFDAVGWNQIGLARYDEAREQFERGRSVLGDVVDDHPEHATTTEGLGAVALGRGEFAEALIAFDKATLLRRSAFPPDHPAFARTNLLRALALAGQGSHGEAVTAARAALTGRSAALGPETRVAGVTAAALAMLGDLADDAAAVADAQTHLGVVAAARPGDPLVDALRVVVSAAASDARPEDRSELEAALDVAQTNGAPVLAFVRDAWLEHRAGE